MAVTGNITGSNTGMYSSSAGKITQYFNWIYAQLNYSITASGDTYIIKCKMRVYSQYEMAWTVYSSNDVKITMTCNGTSVSSDGSNNVGFNLNSSGWSEYTNEVTFRYKPTETKTTLSLKGVLDFSGMVGYADGISYGAGGPVYTSNRDLHFNRMECSGTVDVSSIVIKVESPPSLTTLQNNNPWIYNGVTHSDISASSNSLRVGIDPGSSLDLGNPEGTIYWTCNSNDSIFSFSGTTKTRPLQIDGLNSNTSYTVSVYIKNSAGTTATKTISIKTKGIEPALSGLTNMNQYNNNAGVSKSSTSLTIGLSGITWGEPTATTNWACKDTSTGVDVKTGYYNGAITQFTITDLSPRKTYQVRVQLSNTYGVSETKYITIRTLSNAPIVGLIYYSTSDSYLEKLHFRWLSDTTLKSAQYNIDGGQWIDLGQNNNVPYEFTVDDLFPNTTYKIGFRAVSTDDYDALLSNESYVNATTKDIAKIKSIGECIFGKSIYIGIENFSGVESTLLITTSGNGNNASFSFDIENGFNNNYTFDATQDQLDEIYKCYSTGTNNNSNTIIISFSITTHGKNEYIQSQQNKDLILTGIAKTAHIGIIGRDKPARAQIWIGTKDGVKRAVGWIGGEDNLPHRTI